MHLGPPRRINELDGLRFLAIMAVMAVHYQPANVRWLAWMSNGWAGVDLFFVISGYLITTILMSLRGTSTPYKTFYWRRALRIFPLYYGYLLLYMAITRGDDLSGVGRALFFSHSLSMGAMGIVYQRLFHHAGFAVIPLGVSRFHHVFAWAEEGLSIIWSLSVEEIFYLFWAPVILRGSRKTILYAMSAPIVLCPLLRGLAHTAKALEYYQFVFRADSLMFGAVVAMAFIAVRRGELRIDRLDRWIKVAFGASALALLALVWHDGTFRGIEPKSTYSFALLGYSLYGILFASMVGWCVLHAGSRSFAATALRNPLVRHVGQVSYGVYLIHVFAFIAVLQVARHRWGQAWTPGIGCAACAALLAIAVASLSWKFYEAPILRLKDRYFQPDRVPARTTRQPAVLTTETVEV